MKCHVKNNLELNSNRRLLFENVVFREYRKLICTYEAFCSVVHKPKLESLLVEETFGEGAAKGVRGEGTFLRKLQLGKQILQQKMVNP